MTVFIQIIVGTLGAAVADYLVIGKILKAVYVDSLKPFARLSPDGLSIAPNIVSAGIVYILLSLGLIFFVLSKAANTGQAFGYGALFGLVVYGVYDLTNHAILSGYPLKLVLIDILWGTLLCGALATLLFLIR